ncbi:MAG: N-acetylglucosamine-6-phosphate deacetylase, partial [Atribacterota bacterium]
FALRGNIVAKEKILENGLVKVQNGLIKVLFSEKESQDCQTPTLSFTGCFIFPGLIDLHIHGLLGFDVTEHGVRGAQRLSDHLPTFGVTGFLPTTLTTSWERLLALLNEFKTFLPPSHGAQIFGLHLEGPYLSLERRGAHDPNYLRTPRKEEIASLLNCGEGTIKRITIAPELEGAMETIEYCTNQGILVSLGHSTASYWTTQEAFQRGAKLITHLFNGMDPLYHRKPNLLAFALEKEEIYTEIIADTIHVSPEILQLALRCKTHHKLLPVSNAIKVAEPPDGVYPYQPEDVMLIQGTAILAKSQSLAGSTRPLNQALYHLHRYTGLSFSHLATMGSLLPATLLGYDHLLGSIEKGKQADLVVFDAMLTSQATFIKGEKVYERV